MLFRSPATAYVSPDTFEKDAGLAGQSNAIRIALKENDIAAIGSTAKEIERLLEQDGVSVKSVMSEATYKEGQSAHVRIYIDLLILMAAVMAVVGTLGLMSAMGTNVTERTREFGVMRTIGGRSGTVMRNVVFEGIFIGLMSWMIGIVLSLPLSAIIDNLIGKQAFLSPLPMVLSLEGIIIWAAVIFFGSAAASVYPAWKASQLTIRETLNFI